MMRPSLTLLVTASVIALSACDETFLGDAEPDLDNPFTRGTTESLEEAALDAPVAITASQSWGGTLYAIADETDPRIHALDDSGDDQGEFLITGLNRSTWLDLAVNNNHLLILDRQGGQVLVHSVAEPGNPPPFQGNQAVVRTQTVTLPLLSLSNCSALGIGKDDDTLILLCGGALYSTPLASEDGTTTSATQIGTLETPSSEIVDFSISPGGQYALLTTASNMQVAQSNGSNWAQALNSGARVANYGDADITPVSGAFAFNGILLHALGDDSNSEGALFNIFNP